MLKHVLSAINVKICSISKIWLLYKIYLHLYKTLYTVLLYRYTNLKQNNWTNGYILINRSVTLGKNLLPLFLSIKQRSDYKLWLWSEYQVPLNGNNGNVAEN